MDINLAIVIGTTAYKISCLFVGAMFCVLGYRLFKAGIWGSAGDLDAKFKDAKLVLKSAAPGTFFAVLGCGIVIATIWKGLEFDPTVKGKSTVEENSSNQPQVAEPPPLPKAEPEGKDK